MATPNDHTASFPPGVSVTSSGSSLHLSPPLIDLLATARASYDWPAGTGAAVSQARIIKLESDVASLLGALSPTGAHQIAVWVSHWAGNNANSHANVVGATPSQQATMHQAMVLLQTPGTAGAGVDLLCTLPGISLVIASKIYRFCAPETGAAVDRHSSYFFNSLPMSGGGFPTAFRRGWSNKKHTTTRLATYHKAGYRGNKGEYFARYLPALNAIAQHLNSSAVSSPYRCAATKQAKNWTPADVEMAAYYWWACNGAR